MIDYLIVGQGLAGSVMTLQLIQQNKNILVLDEGSPSSSSHVAAGLFNPIVFKRLSKSWKADELLPFAAAFYQSVEKELHQPLYHSRTIVKIFNNETEKELWKKKLDGNERVYLSEINESVFHPSLNFKMGWAEVNHSGNVDVSMLLESTRNLLEEKKIFVRDEFEFDSLQINKDNVQYKNIIARKIIFCEGYKAVKNPLFNYLPFKLTKGEVITVKLSGFEKEKVVNKGAFVLPLRKDSYKIGATYEWQDLTELPTEKGLLELEDKLKKLVDLPFERLKHEAGIRPTVEDRRPLIGLHPQHSHVVIFNGMGTKGVMLAPFFAHQLIRHMEEEEPLDKEVDIKRYAHLMKNV